MRHFSCDACGSDLTADDCRRYVLRVEGYAAADPAGLIDADLDVDSIEAMGELLDGVETGETDDPAALPPPNATSEYDLCGRCYSRLVNDPLGLEKRRKPLFSQN